MTAAAILCPVCPLCSGPPMFETPNMTPWFCTDDDCICLGWNPYSTLEENLMDAAPARERSGNDDRAE